MISYNEGRFIFKFDPNSKKLCGVYDSKYEVEYSVGTISFDDAFKFAVGTLPVKAAKELKERLKNEEKYVEVISAVISNKLSS